jgi:hypothetical protein
MALRRRLASVGIVAALSVFVAATAVAAVPDSAGVFNGCVNTVTGVLRVIDKARSGPAGACITANGPLKETPITWNQTGPAGPAGTPGTAGPAGPTGPPGPRGPSDAFVTTQLNNGPVVFGPNAPLAGFEPLLLPEGNYLVTLQYDASRSDTSLQAEMVCHPVLSGLSFPVFGEGNIGERGVLGPGVPRMGVTSQALLVVGGGATGVTVQCGLLASASIPRVDVSLIALQVAAATVQD